MYMILVKLKLYSQSPPIKFSPGIAYQASKMSLDPEVNSIKESKDRVKYRINLFISECH